MFEIHQSIIEDQIPQIKFACDISACKGACCTIAGGTGAPLLDEELTCLIESYPAVESILPDDHKELINRKGLYEGHPGSYTTLCYNNRACVFVTYDTSIARCAFEKLYLEGKLNWRKPISCHLFPIRINYGLIRQLRFERISECNPALLHGEKEHTFLSDFLKESLIRAFGSTWFRDFQNECTRQREIIERQKSIAEAV